MTQHRNTEECVGNETRYLGAYTTVGLCVADGSSRSYMLRVLLCLRECVCARAYYIDYTHNT